MTMLSRQALLIANAHDQVCNKRNLNRGLTERNLLEATDDPWKGLKEYVFSKIGNIFVNERTATRRGMSICLSITAFGSTG